VSDLSPLAGLATVVFQVDMGASGFSAAPLLSLNGGAGVAPDFSLVVDGEYSFSFGGPPAPTENHAFQWDLSGFSDPVTSVAVEWTTTPHTTVYALNLDSGDTFLRVIPEPGVGAMVGLGLAGGLILRRRPRRCAGATGR
jgi:hypothetical protein